MDADEVNTEVHFQSQGLGAQIDYDAMTNNNSENGVLREEHDDVHSIDIPEYETTTANESRRAIYPGGNVAMDRFIDKNLRYPKSAYDKGIEGVVRCDFYVSADGVISEINAKCIKMSEGDGAAFNDVRLIMNNKIMKSFINNATHILRTMPDWEPARNSQGNPVLSAQRMYFNYDMEAGCVVYQLDDEIELIDESKMERELEVGDYTPEKKWRWSIGKANKSD